MKSIFSAANHWNLRRITEANDGLWNLITYCAATGGSLLVIGSAAGVAFMGSLEWLWLQREERLGENDETWRVYQLAFWEILRFFWAYDGLWECDPWKADI